MVTPSPATVPLVGQETAHPALPVGSPARHSAWEGKPEESKTLLHRINWCGEKRES
jgi:hypothetical protein